jgi:hemerythrin HHE cation binding domain-containing protein
VHRRPDATPRVHAQAFRGRGAHGIHADVMTTTTAFSPGPVYRLLVDDHARLDGLLARATAHGDEIAGAEFAAFRRGLLRHIGMEEKILLPAARRARGGVPLPEAARLRLDHGALAALLVPSPTPAVVTAIRAVLARHNPLEEGPDGVYATCERIVGEDAGALLAELRAAPEVPVAPHVDSQRVMESARRALARAGYDLDPGAGR